jgi:ATP-dependent Clp protease ATP-binding subunit ClpX
MDNIDKEICNTFLKNIKDFGLIEIIGRLPVLTHMDPLDRETLRAILTTEKCVNQTISKLFFMDDVEFSITDEAEALV